MAYEPRPGDGALFRNENRSTDKHPNATGFVIAHRDIKAGERLRLAAWTKDGGKGKFQSIKMSDDRPRQERDPEPEPQEPAKPDLDDSLPF